MTQNQKIRVTPKLYRFKKAIFSFLKVRNALYNEVFIIEVIKHNKRTMLNIRVESKMEN